MICLFYLYYLSVDGKFHFSFDYDLKKKNGKDYVDLKNPTLTYETKRSYYQFDNLFNGDERLGKIDLLLF